MPSFYTVHEAAEVLRVNPGTLDNWRWLGRGPAYYRIEGKILYTEKDLTKYAASIRVTPKVRHVVVTA